MTVITRANHKLFKGKHKSNKPGKDLNWSHISILSSSTNCRKGIPLSSWNILSSSSDSSSDGLEVIRNLCLSSSISVTYYIDKKGQNVIKISNHTNKNSKTRFDPFYYHFELGFFLQSALMLSDKAWKCYKCYIIKTNGSH